MKKNDKTKDKSARLGRMYRKNPDIVFRVIAGEGVLVPVTRDAQALGRLFTLNQTGVFVWERLNGKRTPEELAELVRKEYGIDEKTARRDVEGLIGKLLGLKAVEKIK